MNQAAVDEKGGGQGALTTDERAELARLRREVRALAQERDFARKVRGVLGEGQAVKYAAIATQAGQFSVAFMCRELGIAPSGYYASQARSPSKKSIRDAALLAYVRAAFKGKPLRPAPAGMIQPCDRGVHYGCADYRAGRCRCRACGFQKF